MVAIRGMMAIGEVFYLVGRAKAIGVGFRGGIEVEVDSKEEVVVDSKESAIGASAAGGAKTGIQPCPEH